MSQTWFQSRREVSLRCRWTCLIALLMTGACAPEAALVPAGRVTEPDSTVDDSTGGSTDTTIVRRGTLTVTVVPAAEDGALASLLGWSGSIAGSKVQVRLGAQVTTGTTDALGRVRFPDLLPAEHQVSVLRALTVAERDLLGPAYAGVDAFGGGGTVVVAAPATEATFTARAIRRGSLVISENFSATWISTNDSYLFGTYMELYNNADTTIYLDGKLFGVGPFFFREAPEYERPCSLTQQWQADPDGLWTPLLYRLPGTGRQYPLAPGEAAVLATDAVNHSVVDPRWPDLSGARFEFLGPSDVDNPAAGNITVVGTPAFNDILGHGPRFDGNSIWFIADPVDVASLPTVQPPDYRVPIPRIPREKILDVVTFMMVPSFYEKYGFQLCPLQIHPIFDTGPAFIKTAALFMSIERTRDGPVLQRSGSTLNDFEITTAPTPGWVR